jgi:hypothetical protein
LSPGTTFNQLLMNSPHNFTKISMPVIYIYMYKAN